MIKVQGLSRNYGDFTAVKNVTFEIGQGEIVGLLGHNGAGKTTIMKMLTGFLEPDSGTIQVNGLHMPEQREKIQEKIGYLPENCPVYPEMTVIDYLEYAAELRGLKHEARLVAVREAIERTELGSKAAETINTLSRGFRQRVGVAQAILCKPEILILDEPTNGLDPTQIQHMRELITSLGRSATIIISTHILQEVQAICDRVLIIRNAELALDASLNDLQKSGRLSLSCSAPPDSIRSLLEKDQAVGQISLQSSDSGFYHYTMVLESRGEANRCVPNIIKSLSGQGVDIYAIHPEHQNLESVFREINAPALRTSKGGETHAA
ncbi:MAG: ABC transporter ATP-binding protein [Gammaproteobacteria bacterium]